MSNHGAFGFSPGEEGKGVASVLLGSVVALNQPSIDLTNVITNSFNKYMIDLLDVYPTTDNVKLLLLFSNSNGQSWITSAQYGYTYYTVYSSPFSGISTNNGTATSIELTSEQGNQTNEKINGTLELRNPNSNTYKHLGINLSSISQQPYYKITIGAGFSRDASPIKAVRMYFSSGNIYGKVSVYGIN